MTIVLIHCWWECKDDTAALEDRQCLAKLNIVFLYNPDFELLGIYPIDLKRYVHTKTCTQMFTAALFIIVKNWKESKCPSIGEWTNKP